VPALYRNTNPSNDKLVSYDLGFPVGWRSDRTTYIVNNQIELVFTFKLHEHNIEVLNLIVMQANCTKPFVLGDNSSELTYYYSVTWREEQEKLEADPDLTTGERSGWIALGFLVNVAYCLAIASVLYRNLLSDLKNCARQIIGSTVQ